MPWIHTLSTLKPTTLPLVHHEDIIVNYLLNPGWNSWNIPLVQSLFNPLDVASILSMPLFTRDYTDGRIWKATVDGTYTVKSAYRICLDIITTSFPTRSENRWNSIWKMQIPPHVRAFLWRSAQHCLPTRANLLSRGIPCDDSCVSCDQLAETQMHVFFVCPSAAGSWLVSVTSSKIFSLMLTPLHLC